MNNIKDVLTAKQVLKQNYELKVYGITMKNILSTQILMVS